MFGNRMCALLDKLQTVLRPANHPGVVHMRPVGLVGYKGHLLPPFTECLYTCQCRQVA